MFRIAPLGDMKQNVWRESKTNRGGKVSGNADAARSSDRQAEGRNPEQHRHNCLHGA